MADAPNGDFWRIELCRHGPRCRMNMRGACGFAHRLSELLPPREVFQEYVGVWNNGVDRFYGQDMPVEQLDRIKKYYNETHPRDKPVWAYALKWFYAQDELGMYARFEWDFGIWQDALSLQRGRIHDRLPFVWASVTTQDGSVLTLPHALRLRREALQGYYPLYRAIAAGPPGPPPRRMVLQEDVSSTGASSLATNVVSAAEWLGAAVEEGIEAPDVAEVPACRMGMLSSGLEGEASQNGIDILDV